MADDMAFLFWFGMACAAVGLVGVVLNEAGKRLAKLVDWEGSER